MNPPIRSTTWLSPSGRSLSVGGVNLLIALSRRAPNPLSRRRRAIQRPWEAEPRSGGAYRDRTGDLMLAKHALSQLS